MDAQLLFTYGGSIALIAFLYFAKFQLLRKTVDPRLAAAVFGLAVIACIPITWALSPDWNNRHVLRVAIYVGNPIATLFVPTVSFLIDHKRRTVADPVSAPARCLFEWFVAIPFWFMAWLFFEFFALDWVWI